MFSMLVQALYNIVDSMFVSEISEDALTAVSLVYPVQTLLIAVGVGTSVGVNSLISRRLGAKRFEEANNAADHGIFIGLVNWAIFALIGVLFGHPIMNSFTDDALVRQMGYSYLIIVMTCSFGAFVEFNTSKTLQATGNMFYPMVAQLIGAGTNIILDPIMIFGLLGFPKMGVAGAAVATVIGQIFAMIFSPVSYTHLDSIQRCVCRTYFKGRRHARGASLCRRRLRKTVRHTIGTETGGTD